MSSIKKKTITRSKLFWGFALIGAAVFIVLGGLGIDLGNGINFWTVLLGLLCLTWLVGNIAEGSIPGLVFPLAFLFLIFEPTIAGAMGREDPDIISNWIVILAALLLTIGLKVLIPGKHGGKKFIEIGSKTVMLDGADLSGAEISDNIGPTDVYITNTEAYTGGGHITISDNVGKVRLYLPKNWNAVLTVEDNIGKIDVPEQEDGVYDQSISIEVTDNVGTVSVIFG